MTSVGQRLADALLFSALTKVFTFALSALLTRSLMPEQKGVAFTLDLYADTVVFISREAVRSTASRISLRSSDNDAVVVYSTQRIVNISAWCVPIAFVVMASLEVLHALGLTLAPSLAHISGLASTHDTGSLSVAIFVSGILLQMCAEPKQAVFRSLLLFRQKIAVEAVALGCRLLTALVLVRLGTTGQAVDPLLCFCIAHFFYGFSMVGYMEAAWSVFPTWVGTEFVSLKQALRRNALLCVAERADIQNPSKAIRRAAFPLSLPGIAKEGKNNLVLWRSFFLDSLLRTLLTEGEKFFLAAFGTMASQGIYDMVMNLGSLVVRVVFRVWEDSCSSTWAQLQAQNAYDRALALLHRMIKTALLLGSAFFLFGPPLARLLLNTLYGSRWTSEAAVQALQQFCVLVPMMGVNGLLEAFIRATGSPKDLRRAWIAMLCSSVVYTTACYYQLVVAKSGDGATGLIRANLVNTGIRCGLSLLVIARSDQFIKAPVTSLSLCAGLFDKVLAGGLVALYFASRTLGSNTDRIHLFLMFQLTHGNVTTLLALVPLFIGLVIWRDSDVQSFLVSKMKMKKRTHVD